MQKFTRPLTREIEVAGERLAVTLDAQGLTVRPVGARKPPHEIGWAKLVHLLTQATAEPTDEHLATAVAALKKGAAPKPASAAPATPVAAAVSAGSMAEPLARMESWLTQHRRPFHSGLLPGASAAELAALEAQLGLPLPDALKAWLATHNGQSADNSSRFEEGWLWMGTQDIATAKAELDAEAAQSPTGWQKTWIPFLDDDDGNYVCLDPSQPGAAVREFWQDQKEHPIVSPSLQAWLADKVQAMEQGDYHEDPERGYFLRKHAAGASHPPTA